MTTRGAGKKPVVSSPVGDVVELFAGVGGFRLGLEGPPEAWRQTGESPGRWRVAWANQWEPSTKIQHAYDCYRSRFLSDDDSQACNRDIAQVGLDEIPDHDLLVGGFPCQDYSVAKPLNQAHGIEGKKGVLWWEIHRIVKDKSPSFLLLENVDRLLKSPGSQRGRDFALVLATLSDLGYLVEWRVVNAAEYGSPQRRKRVFIVGHRVPNAQHSDDFDGFKRITTEGILARALPCTAPNGVADHPHDFEIIGEYHEISGSFGVGLAKSPFLNAGVVLGRRVWTRTVTAVCAPQTPLKDILLDETVVLRDYPQLVVPTDRVGPEQDPPKGTWRYLKGSKREERFYPGSDTPYWYTEGALPFPDDIDRPARTILTGEGGAAPSRFKHIIPTSDGGYRRLAPEELERLNGFPAGWTAGMPDTKRAFCMGNALVVDVVRRIGAVLADELETSRVVETR